MLNRFSFISLFCILLLAFCLYSCKHDVIFPPDYGYSGKPNLNPTPTPESNTCNPDSVYFNQRIMPILVSNCTMSGCHNGNSGFGVLLSLPMQML